MPCNTNALGAAQGVQDAIDVWGPQYVDTAVNAIAATGAPTDGVSSWGQRMQQDGGNAGPPWNWVSGLAILGLTLIIGFVLSLLSQAFNTVPGLGQQISGVIDQFNSWLQQTIHNIAAPMMDGAVHILEGMFDFQMGMLAALVNLAQALVYVRGQIVNDYESLHNTAISYAQSLYNQEELNRQGSEQLLKNDYENLYNLSVQHADAGDAALTNEAQTLDNQLRSDLTGQINGAIAQAQAGDAKVETDFQTVIQTQVQPQINAINAILPSLGTGALATILPQLQALTQTQTALQNQLNTDETNCINPMCENLSDFTRNMGLLNSLGVAAAVIAFIAACMTEPAAVAGAINSVVTPTVDGTVSTTTGVS